MGAVCRTGGEGEARAAVQVVTRGSWEGGAGPLVAMHGVMVRGAGHEGRMGAEGG